MSIRTQQIESTLKRAISEVIVKQLGDPRIVGLVSVTRVQISPDLRDAFVYISVLPEQHEGKSLHGLRSATGRIHSLLRKKVAMRAVPRLDFRLDKSLKKEAVVFDAIRQASERDPPLPDPPQAASDEDEAGRPAADEHTPGHAPQNISDPPPPDKDHPT
jgi:ribosome-binding factor A